MGVTAPRIVVGVDDSDESFTALAWAFRQAWVTGAAVEAVYAFQRPIPVPYSPAIRVPRAEFRAEASAELDRAIAACLSLYPDVAVATTVVEGRPADVFIKAAQGAELLALGSSGTSGIVAMLAGSTDYAVINHSPCPVVLVPHLVTGEGGRHDGAIHDDAGADPAPSRQFRRSAAGHADASRRDRTGPLERRLPPRLLRRRRPA